METLFAMYIITAMVTLIMSSYSLIEDHGQPIPRGIAASLLLALFCPVVIVVLGVHSIWEVTKEVLR